MKKIITLAILQLCLSGNAFARDTVDALSIESALSDEKVMSAVGTDVKFYFGDQKHGKILQNFGEGKTNKKTNAFNKTDEEACQWAFASALLSLKEKALKEGGNAVVNIKSNYKNNLTSSNTTFQCGAGALMAGVALVGIVVKIKAL
jgi:uncharacterized protein YbjQ (UPF0145 family)